MPWAIDPHRAVNPIRKQSGMPDRNRKGEKMFALRRIAVASIVMLMTSPVWAIGYSLFEIDEGGIISTFENYEEYGEHTGLYSYPGGASTLLLYYSGGHLNISVDGESYSPTRVVSVDAETVGIVYQGTLSGGRVADVTAVYTKSDESWDMEGTIGGIPFIVLTTVKENKKGLKRSFTMVWEGNVLSFHTKPNKGVGTCQGVLLVDSEEVATVRCESSGSYTDLFLKNPDQILAWIVQFLVE